MFMCVYESVRDAVGKHGKFHLLAFGWGLAVLASSEAVQQPEGRRSVATRSRGSLATQEPEERCSVAM